jgi:C-terminal processing protease CtpA/Prc
MLMPRLGAVVVLSSILSAVHCADHAEVDPLLSFEGSRNGSIPSGWVGGPPGTLFVDDKVAHGGSWSGRIERSAESPGPFSTFTTWIPLDFGGSTLELRGYLRTEDVKDWAGLWLREDGESGSVAFINMQDREIRGTTPWTEYSIRLPIDRAGRKVAFGALLAGEGKAWVDDLQLLVDGKPVKSAPKIERATTVLDTDREFDAGSKVTVDALTPVQTANLVVLGKVWGFLKYHHPKVVSGAVHWDYELFRVMPQVLAAADLTGSQRAIFNWVKALGEVAACDPCASLPEGLALRPDLDWISDRATLGEPLSALLLQVYRSRPENGEQVYVAKVAGVGNPEFRLEKAYSDPALPDAGTRILALYRWWSVVQYWSPYRDVIGADWNAVLPEFLPRMVAAKDVDSYRLEMLALISRLNDAHANLWGSLTARPPRGDCQIPVRLRFIEGNPVVVGFTGAEPEPGKGLELGDAILALDGVPIERLIEPWKPYYSASNDAGRMAAIMNSLTQGECGVITVSAKRSGAPLTLALERRRETGPAARGGPTHDLPGPAFRRLSPEVAYLKLSAVKKAEIPEYVRSANGSKGWIVDIRNYPSEFVVFALGGHFVSEPTPFVRFTIGDGANPGAFAWTDPPLAVNPIEPRYAGKVVVLVDETTISQAEYTAMALRAAPHAIVVGSATVGADGNVSKVLLPGGLSSLISGIGVFYPDKKPTQRVGIVPDVEVRPSIAGIRERRDEVLETAIRQIVGPDVPEATIRAIAKP